MEKDDGETPRFLRFNLFILHVSLISFIQLNYLYILLLSFALIVVVN